jgi:phage shock protein A
VEYIEAIVSLTKELNIASGEKEKKFIKTTINQLKDHLDKVDKVTQLEERISKIESKMSFIDNRR